MDYPDFEGISDIQDTSAMMSSRLSTNLSPRNNVPFQYTQPPSFINGISFNSETENSCSNQPSFLAMRQYAENVLSNWGLKIGHLSESEENKKTIKCLLEMISQRFKDTENRQKMKEKFSQLQFERNKYSSLLEQSRKTNDEKNKQLGKLENSYQDLRTKMRKLENQTKKQRDDDKKMIMMLKGKNQQIMHQVKKRQQQVNRVKEQMKKNVGEKNNTSKALNFEVHEVSKIKRPNEEDTRLEMLAQKFQLQKKTFMKQNLLLKEKLYDIREQIVGLAEWIDINIFGQKTSNYKNSFIVNHNHLFRKECLVDELKQVIQTAKDGMNQIIDMKKGLATQLKASQSKEKKISPKNKRSSPNHIPSSPRELQKSPRNKNLIQSKNFKKKVDTKEKIGTRQTLPRSQKPSLLESEAKTKLKSKQNLTESKRSQTAIKNEESIVFGEEDSDLSIISHISMTDVGKGMQEKFDKWDILFKE